MGLNMNIRKLILKYGFEKKFIKNISFLGINQFVISLIPLFIYPYLLRMLGPDRFGVIVYVQVFVSYFLNFVDYGFGLFVTREISNNKNSFLKLGEIFSSALMTKLILLLFAFLFYVLLIFSFDIFKEYQVLYLLFFCVIFFQSLFPIWLFQGLEKMKYIPVFSIISQIVYCVGVVFFVKTPNDYLLVPAILAFAYLIYSLGGIYQAFLELEKKIHKPSLKIVKRILLNGFPLSFSSFLVKMFKNNVIVFFGFFAPYSVVGYFSIAKKVIDLFCQVSNIVSQAIFPHVVANINIAKQHTLNLLKRVVTLLGLLNIFVALFLFFIPDWVLIFLTGEVNEILQHSLKLMSIVPLIISLNIPAVQGLIGLKEDKYFVFVIMFATLVDVMLCIIILPLYGYKGASIIVFTTETLVTITLYIVYVNKLRRASDARVNQ